MSSILKEEDLLLLQWCSRESSEGSVFALGETGLPALPVFQLYLLTIPVENACPHSHSFMGRRVSCVSGLKGHPVSSMAKWDV